MLIERQRLSHLDLTRVIALLFVLFIHSPITSEQPVVRFIKNFIGCGAVPVFFMLSGYLGARKMESPQSTLMVHVRDKARTLLIPFLFWNLLLLTLVMGVKLIGLDSVLRGNGGYFDVHPNLKSIICALFGIGRFPVAYQFWFLRDLMVVNVIGFIIQRYSPAIPLLAWLFFLLPFPIGYSFAFFFMGNQLHAILPSSKVISPISSGLYCLIWVILGIFHIQGKVAISSPILELGSAAFLFLLSSSLIYFSIFQKLSLLAGGTFMIYALHEPSQTVISKVWLKSGLPGYGSVLCFLIIPLTVYPACWFVYYVVKRYFPKLLPYATGGR